MPLSILLIKLLGLGHRSGVLQWRYFASGGLELSTRRLLLKEYIKLGRCQAFRFRQTEKRPE